MQNQNSALKLIEPSPQGLPQDTEQRLSRIYSTMEQQDFRAFRRSRQLALRLKTEHGLTQQDIASRVGWTQGNLALYLNGYKAIGRNVLPLMAVALDAEPFEIRTELKDPGEEKIKKSMRLSLVRQAKALKTWLKRDDLNEEVRQEMVRELESIEKILR